MNEVYMYANIYHDFIAITHYNMPALLRHEVHTLNFFLSLFTFFLTLAGERP